MKGTLSRTEKVSMVEHRWCPPFLSTFSNMKSRGSIENIPNDNAVAGAMSTFHNTLFKYKHLRDTWPETQT